MTAMRLLLPFLLLAVCSCEGEKTADDKETTPQNPTKETRSEPESPATGIPQIQRSYDMWERILTAEEKKVAKETEEPDERTVKQVVRGCDMLIKALEISIREEAKSSARFKHARMRSTLEDLRKQRSVVLREDQEIQSILKDAAAGIAPIPSGFTRAELEDNLADVKEEMRKLNGRLNDHKETMTKLEQALTAGETPEPEETMASRELEAVRALRKRAEALLR